MQTGYYDVCTKALIQVSDAGAFALVGSVRTPREYRGHGIASRLMREVIRDSERERKVLALVVAPDPAEHGPSFAALYGWYVRLGFEEWDREYEPDPSFWMRRIPASRLTHHARAANLPRLSRSVSRH